tara:strand:+ start:1894 stop:2463 length:570 start_codon:yes stop_codon:yes gene_type:complete
MIYQTHIKRAFDILFSIISLLALLPIFLIIYFSILIFDGPSVFFCQKRIGRNKQEFDLFKFRSLPKNTKAISSDKLSEIKISKIGKFIRRTNIDELPQLFNILKGEMSFVGPRPSLSSQKDLISLREINNSLSLTPGLTGLAQISSYNGMSEKIKSNFDGKYYNKISFIFDLKILFRTFIYLLKPPPIY